jgi:tryptophan synthase alpha chain
VAAFADGVIVGSAFVRRLLPESPEGIAGVRDLTTELSAGVRRTGAP